VYWPTPHPDSHLDLELFNEIYDIKYKIISNTHLIGFIGDNNKKNVRDEVYSLAKQVIDRYMMLKTKTSADDIEVKNNICYKKVLSKQNSEGKSYWTTSIYWPKSHPDMNLSSAILKKVYFTKATIKNDPSMKLMILTNQTAIINDNVHDSIMEEIDGLTKQMYYRHALVNDFVDKSEKEFTVYGIKCHIKKSPYMTHWMGYFKWPADHPDADLNINGLKKHYQFTPDNITSDDTGIMYFSKPTELDVMIEIIGMALQVSKRYSDNIPVKNQNTIIKKAIDTSHETNNLLIVDGINCLVYQCGYFWEGCFLFPNNHPDKDLSIGQLRTIYKTTHLLVNHIDEIQMRSLVITLAPTQEAAKKDISELAKQVMKRALNDVHILKYVNDLDEETMKLLFLEDLIKKIMLLKMIMSPEELEEVD